MVKWTLRVRARCLISGGCKTGRFLWHQKGVVESEWPGASKAMYFHTRSRHSFSLILSQATGLAWCHVNRASSEFAKLCECLVELQWGSKLAAFPTYSRALLLQTTRRRCSNRAKLGPEQGTKKPIPPNFIKNWPIPRTFWGSTYKNTPFGFCGCSHKVDNKTKN